MKISVIIPVAPQFQHAEKYLERCLASVLWQLQRGDEVIIEGVDERSSIFAERFWPGEAEVKFLPVVDGDGGPSARRNRAAAAASGDWLKFLDCDDLLAPFALDQFRKLGDAVGNVLGAPHVVTGPQIKVLNGMVQLGGPLIRPNWNVINRCNPTLPSMTFVRKSAFDAVGGFDERVHFEEDWELWLKLQQRFTLAAFATVGWPVCYYWIDEAERATKNFDHQVEGKDVRAWLAEKYGITPA
jgi:glycosyltransferase involved in cell wall biosynthesis